MRFLFLFVLITSIPASDSEEQELAELSSEIDSSSESEFKLDDVVNVLEFCFLRIFRETLLRIKWWRLGFAVAGAAIKFN